MTSFERAKKPFKLVEIPVNNFKEIAIPHHLKLLADYKEIVQNDIKDSNKMKSECVSIKRVIAQLKSLLYELDTLRAQVEDQDLDKFDVKTVSLRKNILQIISEYTELLKQASSSSTTQLSQQFSDNNRTEDGLTQLQIKVSVDELKLQQKEECLRDVEKLHTDIQDLHTAYGSLHQMVVEQKENVDIVEENVESAHENVNTGARHVLTAARLKASIYPLTGAIVGTCVGGPLGLLAGLKVGGIAALGCGVMGFVGGKFLKKQKLDEPALETSIEAPQENISTDQENSLSQTKKEE